MLLIPVNNHEVKSTIMIIIIQPDNFERMKVGDPLTFQSASLGGLLPTIAYPNRLYMVIAYEEDLSKVYELSGDGKYAELMNYLHRGYSYVSGLDGIGMMVDPSSVKESGGTK